MEKVKRFTLSNLTIFILKGIRFLIRKQARQTNKWSWPKEGEREQSNFLIYKMLTNDDPCLIGRVGTSESNIVNNYIAINNKKSALNKIIESIIKDKSLPFYDFKAAYEVCFFSGFFPNNRFEINKFCELYLNVIPEIDIFGRMTNSEEYLPINKFTIHVQLETLYPFFVEKPWTKALEGKNVLVIHPFAETIQKQYLNKGLIFNSSDLLPDFNLIILKSVQSIADNEVPFNTWFDALEFMKRQIDEIDFDIAIIGCGAYGLPLAAYIKRIGKKSILLSGGLQLLFGIKGKRWEVDYYNSCYRDMFNDYWVYPSENDKPVNADKIEGGCYW